MKATWSWTRLWAAAAPAIAALKGKRRYLGYEIEADYVRLAQKRIKQFRQEVLSPSLLDLLGDSEA